MLAKLVGNDVALSETAGSLLVSGLTADSREVMPGFVFAALPGTKVDGGRYIGQAFERGASVVIADRGSSYSGSGLVIETANPRQLFARMAARFFGKQPNLTVAVTGTNGKTSVAAFVRQIWLSMGFRAASIGTIGVAGPSGTEYLSHTTPDPVQLQRLLAKLAEDHVGHLVLEASSHGLAQYRLDGIRFAAAAFTNLTRDHLDYHATLEDYLKAKMRLFEELLPAGAPAVINADTPVSAEVTARAKASGLKIFSVGKLGVELTLLSSRRDGSGQQLELQGPQKTHSIYLPLVGDFQASNALVAAGLVLATGGEETLVMHALESLQGAKGRLDLVGKSRTGASIFVDYAHTPDALENAITALKPYTDGKLVVVFGCGGDRDKGKRPQMGAIAAKYADKIIVTDDNPRSEDAKVIRAEILAACPGAEEIGDRAKAIVVGVEGLAAGDVLLVAGKGHEEGQTIGSKVIPFSDHQAVLAAIAGEAYHG
ncbi:MAG: UDP-N-acetylmuramoyl-L-alanyl-D-glutamate--2,6-diaminopimelate ligase [Aestuariivirga sp.]